MTRDPQAGSDAYRGGGAVGCARRSTDDVDESTGFFRARRDDAARSVIFEAAPYELHAVGQQRRGDRVTCETGDHPAIELEVDFL